MTFQVKEPLEEALAPDSDDSGEEEEMPLVTADVSVTCKSVELDEDSGIPKKVYLNFKNKGGSKLVFRNFVKQAFIDLDMFILPTEWADKHIGKQQHIIKRKSDSELADRRDQN